MLIRPLASYWNVERDRRQSTLGIVRFILICLRMAASTAVTAASGIAARPRVVALDVVRGAVMVLMAIDHVRVYSGVPAGGPTVGVFLTRWVTHFCAPAFVFLAGTAAFLRLQKVRDRGALAR